MYLKYKIHSKLAVETISQGNEWYHVLVYFYYVNRYLPIKLVEIEIYIYFLYGARLPDRACLVFGQLVDGVGQMAQESWSINTRLFGWREAEKKPFCAGLWRSQFYSVAKCCPSLFRSQPKGRRTSPRRQLGSRGDNFPSTQGSKTSVNW